ncbi:hypothetical protein [Pseudomonas citronellolis]|uniref:hypothetical protein n=1 Tax=Pseudomonas citronellolis TaxID=53408 RepID=UPI000778DAD9|nr:hypothetical protein [Pseudomonas citronellolis]
MMSDSQSRAALKKLLADHVDKSKPSFESLVEIIEDSSRQVPIRGVLEYIGSEGDGNFTKDELSVIEELIYMYG